MSSKMTDVEDSPLSSPPSTSGTAGTDQDVLLRIHDTLIRIVVDTYRSGNLADLTVKRVRQRTEAELGLDDGFLKTDPEWSAKSKDIISAEAVSFYPMSPYFSIDHRLPECHIGNAISVCLWLLTLLGLCDRNDWTTKRANRMVKMRKMLKKKSQLSLFRPRGRRSTQPRL